MKNAAPLLFVFGLGIAPSFAQKAGNPAGAASKTAPDTREVKDTYHVVRVDPFDVLQGVEFPAEFLGALREETAKQLAEAKLFHEVLPAGQNQASSNEPVLRLSATITHYTKGSRAKRYFGVRGAGATEIDARIFFLDGATGRQLMTEDLRAILAGGFFGGNEANAIQEFAREIITRTKLMLMKRVPPPEEADAAPPAAGTPSAASPPARERHTLTISAKDWSDSQQKLDQQAAAGYRVIGLSLTGIYTADVELEKSAAPPDVYQYRLLHTVQASNLEKDIKKVAEEGFRVSAHTLTSLGARTTLIMEKPPGPPKAHYLYIVKESFRISSAQKDIEKYQNQGYVLVEETEHNGLHSLLFEKAAEAGK